MPQAFSSVSPLAGARDVNRITLPTAQEDLGGKVATLISTVNALVSAVSTLNTAVSFINVSIQRGIVCAASFASAFSTGDIGSANATSTLLMTSYAGTFSNFRA